LILSAVTDRLARSIDSACERRIRDDPAAPDRTNEVVLADDAVAVLYEIDQKIEHLGLDRNALRAPMQFAPVGIEHKIGKNELHGGSSPELNE
jgi:hypothetical protein